MDTTNKNEISPSEVERWKRLFNFNSSDALCQISAHRRNPVIQLQDDKWEAIRWGHEAAGYNREACEYLLGLKEMARKQKQLPSIRRCRTHYKHYLGGFLAIDTVYQLCHLGPVPDDFKSDYYIATLAQHKMIQRWVKARKCNIVKGTKAYNNAWTKRVANKEVQSSAEAVVAQFQNLSHGPSRGQTLSGSFAHLTSPHVGFIKLEGDMLAVDPFSLWSTPAQPWLRRRNAMSVIVPVPEERLPPFFPPTLPDRSQRIHIPTTLPAPLPPWTEVGMQHFLNHIVMRVEFSRPQFRHASLNSLTGEVAFEQDESEILPSPTGTVIHHHRAADAIPDNSQNIPAFGDAPRVVVDTPVHTPTQYEAYQNSVQYNNATEAPSTIHDNRSNRRLESSSPQLPDDANTNDAAAERWSWQYRVQEDERRSTGRPRRIRGGERNQRRLGQRAEAEIYDLDESLLPEEIHIPQDSV